MRRISYTHALVKKARMYESITTLFRGKASTN